MLDGLALVVLDATSLVELIVANKEVKYLFIAVPCYLEQWILTQVVLHRQCLEFLFLEELQ
jgi:hypothetical protein